ncbi:MAG TPA: glutamate-cysteine ligase family protein [Polyangiaceae bacterium]
MTTDHTDSAPIVRKDDLLSPFVEACKPPSQWRIGPEMEKFGIFEKSRQPIPYEGDRSVLRFLEELVRSSGWTAERERADGPIVALLKGGASVTLEPGGQLELSGKMSDDVHEIAAETRDHLREIGPLSQELGVKWLGVGFHPFARREDFSWVPKQRYAIMRSYLPTRGAHALDMMLRTSTVQANYDYSDEKDAMRKMRVALALSPVTTAMFANSPWKEGQPSGGLTYRGRIWLDVDPDRSGLLPSLWRKGAGFEDYVEWALDVPMFLFKRDGRAIANTGQTFRGFHENGFEGHKPTIEDWKLHLNTLFPEVRLKKTIEIRGADTQTTLAAALPALWTGIFYDEHALGEAEAMVEGWGHDDSAELRTRLWREGLQATFRQNKLAYFAERLVAIAEQGLARRARIDPVTRQDERVHLAGLRTLVGKGLTPADVLLHGMDREKDPAAAIVARTAFDLG